MNDNNNHVKGINSIGPHKIKSKKYSQCVALLLLSLPLFLSELFIYEYQTVHIFLLNAYSSFEVDNFNKIRCCRRLCEFGITFGIFAYRHKRLSAG